MKRLIVPLICVFLSTTTEIHARRTKKTIDRTPTTQAHIDHKIDAEPNEPVCAQWGMLADLALQQAIMMGQGAADSLFYEEDQKKQKKLFDKQKEISETVQKKRDDLNKTLKAEREKLSTLYSDSFKSISESLHKASQDSLVEMNYIQRLVGKSADGASSFITRDPIPWDKAFAGSSTRLPPAAETGPVWHNVAKDSGVAGNWIYDANIGGFVQCGYSFLSPVFKTSNVPGVVKNRLSTMADYETKDKIIKKFNPDYAASNIIFTPYYPKRTELKAGYLIRAEITLINATFPFCAGIVFNKARYLAGSVERPFIFRFAGLYGDENKKIGLYFGQTTTEKSAGQTFVQSPFDKIFTQFDEGNPPKIKRSAKELYSLTEKIPGTFFLNPESIGKDPITYVLEIANNEQYVNIALFNKGEKKSLYSSENLDPSQYPALLSPKSDTAVLSKADPAQNEALFWYHDIGLSAIGCQALFNITSPEKLMPQKNKS